MTSFPNALPTYGDQDTPLRNQWTDIFRRDQLVHLGVLGSIVAATFQGYLKDRIGGAIPYALADACFMAAAAAWFGTLAVRHEPIRGPGRVPYILLAVGIVPAAYLLYPTAPLVVQLAGLRAWAEFPMGCLMALSVIRNAGQARAYIGTILVLCFSTAIYGILQYQAGPQAALNIGGLAQLRHGSSTFYFIEGTGRTGFRAFSTFTFPAPFAMMMVFGALLAMGIAVGRLLPKKRRLLAALLVPLLFFGMTVSGTRAALIILMAGLVLVAWFRRLSAGQILLLPILIGAFHVASLFTSGGALERFRTILLEEGLFWRYVAAPVTIAIRALLAHPLGLGLGRSGVGVPFSIFTSQPTGFFMGSDGDIGRAAVEMGIIGILLLFLIIAGLLPYAARAARVLAGTEAEDLALGIAPLLITTGLGVLIGSPFASAPHGIIWWYLLGTLLKLAMLEEQRREG
ncbi:MAG: hypothetical protein HY700_18105 [Gemmatimonadetes bacterium]|nr:hypothetical protein [Gemmatimonadota bacterium]